MRGMNSGCVDLIYLDPPFNSNRNYQAPIGSDAAGASFKDAWTLDDIDVCEHGELAERAPAVHHAIAAARYTHGKGMMAYLIFMAVRLMEMKRILKTTGSIYLHCDPTASHYLKMLMDGIFGNSNFQNEIIWCYSTGGASKKRFAKKHDVILAYGNGEGTTFNTIRIPYTSAMSQDPNHAHKFHPDGKICLDWWPDIPPINPQAKERTGYPTQKPVLLLERIITASSNPGDMIFDPFCGCATTLVAADRLGRDWSGCDLSELAIKLVNERISNDRGLFGGAIVPDEPPTRTDQGELPNYRTNAHRIYGEQEGVCVGCHMHFPFKIMEIDHILPQSRGGTDATKNLQMLCSHCNRSKGDKTMAEWIAARGDWKYPSRPHFP